MIRRHLTSVRCVCTWLDTPSSGQKPYKSQDVLCCFGTISWHTSEFRLYNIGVLVGQAHGQAVWRGPSKNRHWSMIFKCLQRLDFGPVYCTVTGSGSTGDCCRLSQSSGLFGRTIIYTDVPQKVPTFKLSVTLSILNRFPKFLHCSKAYEICYKTKRQYAPHLRRVATLPWEIKKSNFLQTFSRYGRKCKEIAF